MALAFEHRRVVPTGVERTFGQEEVIVSKTDTRGVITYANTVFCRVSGYSRDELIGVQHSVVRHPDMPRCVFKYFWDVIGAGNEIFAYVKNMAINGDTYWVFAHVTPTFSPSGEIVGYHSNRRSPNREAIQVLEPLYAEWLAIENRYDRREGLDKSFAAMVATLQSTGKSYDELIFSITP